MIFYIGAPTENGKRGRDSKKALEGIKKRQLSGDLGRPLDAAYAALYLASDESEFMMGSPLYIDGGATFGKDS
jgi:NAD(P)-dependent dehydrogenase (short-subunit alcohol dehydrogenase family)